ncbi:unnamed protein product [Boreogadus saida]
MPRLIVVFTSFYALILALKKSGEVEQRDRILCAVFQVRVCVVTSARRRWRLVAVGWSCRILLSGLKVVMGAAASPRDKDLALQDRDLAPPNPD